jgi:hypothetical protein
VKEDNLEELIESATAMLLDRIPLERQLIYEVALLSPQERTAIVIAYAKIAAGVKE